LVSVSASVPQRLLDSLGESPVAAYVKDLDGRYLHVNRRYEEFFEIGCDDLRGRMDGDLKPGQTIDGPRLAGGRISEGEPLQLEYTVAPFDRRPALAVWRFAVRTPDGDTVAVCGIAAPVRDAVLARRECERVMAVAQGVKETAQEPVPEVDEPQPDDRIAADHAASASAERRVQELLGELTAERERRAEADTVAQRERERADAAILAERSRADEAASELNAVRGELASVRGRLEGAEASAEREAARAEEADAVTRRDRVRIEEVLAELNAARGELASVRGRLEGVEAAAQREAARVEEFNAAAQRERSRAEEALAELNEVRRDLEVSRAELESERQQQTHSKKKIVEDLRRQLADVVAEMEEERARAERFSTELNAAREELAAARAEFASEREQRTRSEQEVVDDLRKQLADAVADAQAQRARAEESDAAVQAERDRADQSQTDLDAVRAQLEAADAELAAERKQRTHSEQEVVDDLRRQLAGAVAELEATRGQLEAAHAELAAEREQRTHSDQELVNDLRRRLEEAAEATQAERRRADGSLAELSVARAELDIARAELDTARAEVTAVRAELATQQDQRTHTDQELLDELRHKVEHATATARQEKDRADGAEVALNAERADAEIRVSVAERRIAELEASLSEARASALEIETDHGDARPRWNSSAQRAFTTALTQSSDWRVSVKSAIGVIGSQGGWDAVCAWQPDDRNGFASCFAMWTGENRRLGSLETATWQRRQPLAGSTIGEALGWEESRWLAADPKAADRRLQLLAQHGIRGALIVPVRDGVRPVTALELLTADAAEPSRALVDAMETIALQLGHFSHLLSEGAQPRWRFGRV
jgi:chromosome segregation ATPase